MKKRLIALGLILVLVLGCLAGCGNKTEEPAQDNAPSQPSQSGEKEPEKEPEPQLNLRKTTDGKSTNTFTYMDAAKTTFDEAYHKAAHEDNIIGLLFDSLYWMDKDGEWHPMLAEMTPNEDGSAADVTLRDDVYFHSGDKMTAEDLVFSLDHLKDSPQGAILAEITYLEVVDDYHLIWYFPIPTYNAFTLMEYLYRVPVLNKSYYEEKYDTPYMDFGFDVDGTGPYVVESFEAATQNITLKKFDNYWGDRGYFDKIVMLYGTGDTEMAFETGEIDYAVYTGSTFANAEAYDNVNTEIQYEDAVTYLICNSSEGHPTSDIRVREALQYAFDREEIGILSCDDAGVVAWNFIYPTVQYYADITPHRTLDVEKAKALMKEAGYSESNKCPVTLLTTGHTAWVATVQALKENLDACYFDVSISQTQDFTPYYGGQFDICIVGMAMGRMFNFFSQLWDPATGINFCYYDGPDLQEIIDGFQTAQDQESANAVILKQDATFCYVPLAYDACLAAFDDQLDTSEAWSGAGYDFSRIKWK